MGRMLVSAGAAALCGMALPTAAFAQAGAIVVQALPNRSSLTLNQALARLGQNPRDIDALIDAGNAALAMGDVDASVGFFRRADQISPGNGRVKAGLAGALVHSENPYDAIPLFEEAERAGAGEGVLGGERGLAYDLVGDNEKAQRYYKAALASGPDDETIRRLALSYAIGGDKRSAETVLTPLLQKQDKASWRTRAFSLAIMGQVDEAVSIANTTLPQSLAAGISPYLRYMPRLTPAQQAAAANLGHFPRASEIGRDDPRAAQYAPKTRRPAQLAAADTALTPRGQPLGRGDKSQAGKRSDTALAANTSARTPVASQPNATSWRSDSASGTTRRASTQTVPATTTNRTPALAAAQPAHSVAPPLTRPATTPPQLTPSRTTTVAAPSLQGPSLSVSPPAVQGPPAPVHGPPAPTQSAPVFAAATPTPTPVAAAAPAPTPAAPPPKVNLADAFSDFLKPTIDVAPAEGAVDVRGLAGLAPSRQQAETRAAQTPVAKNGKPVAAAAKPVKPPPPSHPSRTWVQVATGRNKTALALDWRKMSREKAAVLRGKSAFISAWGQTNRLLTGPFPSDAAANAFIAQLRRADIDDAFLWTSPAGQVVDPIAAK